MEKRLLIFLIMAVFCAGLVSANIVFPDLKEIYGLNEEVNFSFSVESSKDLYGTISMELRCGDIVKELAESEVNLKQGEVDFIEVPKFNLENLGECNLYSSLADSSNNIVEEKTSKGFSVEAPIKISASLNQYRYSPGESSEFCPKISLPRI